MKKSFKILICVFIAANLYSLVPIVSFYFKKPAEIKALNYEAADKLKGNKDPYFEFIVISDTGSGMFFTEASTLKLASGINREDRFKKVPIDFVVNVGDVTFRGRESHYKNYLKIKDMIKFPVIDAMGNHDDDLDNGPRGLALFNRYCGKDEFSFQDRNSYFIVLNDIDGEFKESQFAWFKEELNKAKSYKHIFVFMHKPPFNPCQEAWYRIETTPWSLRFMKLCDEYGVRAVFSGHENICRVVKFGSVTYIVSGGGGTLLVEPSYRGGFLNYVVVKVNGDYMDYEIRKVQPPIWEFFAYYMWKDLVFCAQSWLN